MTQLLAAIEGDAQLLSALVNMGLLVATCGVIGIIRASRRGR